MRSTLLFEETTFRLLHIVVQGSKTNITEFDGEQRLLMVFKGNTSCSMFAGHMDHRFTSGWVLTELWSGPKAVLFPIRTRISSSSSSSSDLLQCSDLSELFQCEKTLFTKKFYLIKDPLQSHSDLFLKRPQSYFDDDDAVLS